MLPATLTGHSWEPGWKVPDQVSGLELGSIAPGIGPVVLLDKIWNLADSKFDNFQPPGPGIPRPWRAGAPWGWQRLARGGRGRGFGRGRWGRPPRSLGRGTRAEHPPAWVARCWSSFSSRIQLIFVWTQSQAWLAFSCKSMGKELGRERNFWNSSVLALQCANLTQIFLLLTFDPWTLWKVKRFPPRGWGVQII